MSCAGLCRVRLPCSASMPATGSISIYLWASSQSDIYVPRPPSVEAFLPISALVNLKRLVLTGQFDTIHPAGLTIFMAALVIGLLLRKGFCGWICPVGFASNLAEAFSRRFKLLAQAAGLDRLSAAHPQVPAAVLFQLPDPPENGHCFHRGI